MNDVETQVNDLWGSFITTLDPAEREEVLERIFSITNSASDLLKVYKYSLIGGDLEGRVERLLTKLLEVRG